MLSELKDITNVWWREGKNELNKLISTNSEILRCIAHIFDAIMTLCKYLLLK